MSDYSKEVKFNPIVNIPDAKLQQEKKSLESTGVENNDTCSKECKNAEDQMSVVGRSVAFKGVDSVAKDLTFFLKNPELAQKAVRFSEMAESSMPYEQACSLAKPFAQEFSK